MHRWIFSHPARAAITNECKIMAGKDDGSRIRRELDKTRIARDEEDVQKVINTINAIANPFEKTETALLHLSSGVVAEKDVLLDLMKAKDIGEEIFQDFCKNRLQATTIGFSEPLKKRKGLTLGVMGKKKTTKASGKERTLKADKKLFAEFMLVGSTRKVQLEEMLKHHLQSQAKIMRLFLF